MRRAGMLLLAVAAVAAGYLAVAGWLLQRAAAELLTVGTIATLVRPPVPVTDPFELGFRGDPRSALGLSFETVMLETPVGPAEAWYVPGTRDDLAAIYVHGVAGAREDGYRHLSVLAEAGVPVLLIAYRNDPEAPAAPGWRYTMGITEWEDLDVAVAAMAARQHDRLVLAGESMGGAIVGQFLRRSERSRLVAAVILDAPALDFTAVLANIAAARNLPLPGVVARVALYLLSVRGPDDLRETDVIDAVAGFDGPVFLAHGGGDRVVPVVIAERLLAARVRPTHHLRTTADHLQSWHADPAAYRAALRGFLAGLGDP